MGKQVQEVKWPTQSGVGIMLQVFMAAMAKKLG